MKEKIVSQDLRLFLLVRLVPKVGGLWECKPSAKLCFGGGGVGCIRTPFEGRISIPEACRHYGNKVSPSVCIPKAPLWERGEYF